MVAALRWPQIMVWGPATKYWGVIMKNIPVHYDPYEISDPCTSLKWETFKYSIIDSFSFTHWQFEQNHLKNCRCAHAFPFLFLLNSWSLIVENCCAVRDVLAPWSYTVHGWSRSSRALMRTPFQHVWNGWPHCAETWCLARPKIAMHFIQPQMGYIWHVPTPFLSLSNRCTHRTGFNVLSETH